MKNKKNTLNFSQKLWKRAKKTIPDGNMFLSKRPEMILPHKWPTYFKKAKGCKIWDLDGNIFNDVYLMGVGTNVLGYGNASVDEAVKKVIKDGNMSTFNSPDEVYLSEKLIQIHQGFHNVKLARTGGEANAIAIRIARASTKKNKIAVCGYHGWHDWYLSANLTNKNNLNEHLLPGLKTEGVPKNLSDTVYTFNYNEFDQLENLVKKNPDIGIIKMEVTRNIEPKNNFLKKVRNFTKQNNIILIFDECTTGFRQSYGGLYQKYNIKPDMIVFGKALGNGYAITSILGKKRIMENAKNSFISSTFWSEKIGPAAALATINEMNRVKSWKKIEKKSLFVKENWQKIAKKNDLEIDVYGNFGIIGFKINSSNFIKYKNYLTQEFLKNKYLASNNIYLSTAHTDDILEEYLSILNKIFPIIKDCENGRNIDKLLESPIAQIPFKRLN